jgi:integrase/recombinase XerC
VSKVTIDETSPLAELATSFARSLRSERKSANTIEIYLRAILEFDRYLTAHAFPREVAKIERKYVEGFLEDQLEKNKPATASVRHAGLRRFLSWCVSEREIAVSPMDRVKAPSVPETLPTVLRDEQVEAMLRDADGPTFRQRRDYALILFATDTGCRRSEMAGLTLDVVDQDACTAKVTGKGDREREVPFSDRTNAALDRYLRMRKKHRYAGSPSVWLGPNGPLTVDAIAAIVVRRATRAGVTRPDGKPIVCHMTRHFMADRALRNGVSEGDLMTIGGWKSATVMRSYGRGNRTERASAAMRRVFASS